MPRNDCSSGLIADSGCVACFRGISRGRRDARSSRASARSVENDGLLGRTIMAQIVQELDYNKFQALDT